MTRLVNLLAGLLEPEEREAVLGDLAEGGANQIAAVRDLLGLLLRRQWTWPTLLLLLSGGLLGMSSRSTADGSAVYLWLFANNWDWALMGNAGFRHDLTHYGGNLVISLATLACWSCAAGFLIGTLSRRAGTAKGVLFCLIVLATPLVQSPRSLARDFEGNAAVFAMTFYRVVFPALVLVLLVLVPALWAMRKGSPRENIISTYVLGLH
uniref:Uncharacterized protein n=1 Tax=Solibacter usitatus (strain Ellin6076) TaxID=234267 RepID=Q01QT7_SOLUE